MSSIRFRPRRDKYLVSCQGLRIIYALCSSFCQKEKEKVIKSSSKINHASMYVCMYVCLSLPLSLPSSGYHCGGPRPMPAPLSSPMTISSPSITAPHSVVCTFSSNASRFSSSPLMKGISRTRIGCPMSTSEITLWIITPVLSILPSSQASCARSMAFCEKHVSANFIHK